MRNWMLAVGCVASLTVAQEPKLSQAALDADAALRRGEYMVAYRMLGRSAVPSAKEVDDMTYQT